MISNQDIAAAKERARRQSPSNGMTTMADHLARFKLPEKTSGRTVERWQDYAANVTKKFKLDMRGKAMIFKYCKMNLHIVERNVAMAEEKAAMNSESTEKYGAYLISLFRKKKPWEQ